MSEMEQKPTITNTIEKKPLIQDISGQLSENFDVNNEEQISGYEMSLPQSVMDFCTYIDSIGGRALVVGGCVRDMITAKEEDRVVSPKDIDIEVYGIQPSDLLKLVDHHFGLEEAGTFGKKFEIIKIFGRGDYDLDISSPRSDNKTGRGSKGFETSSHPEFTVKEAAVRRDLTCNSVSYDPIRKLVYDPFSGIEDIKNKIIRATDPEKFIEDPVRILRIMQFTSRFNWKIDPQTERLCQEMLTPTEEKRINHAKGEPAIELDSETNDRIWGEFYKLLTKGIKPSLGLEFAKRIGIIDRYYPWLAELTVTRQDEKWHPEGSAWEHTMQAVDAAAEIARREHFLEEETLFLVFAALCHDLGKPTTTTQEKRIVEGAEREVISSRGHDQEGIFLSNEFIQAFANARIPLYDDNGDYCGIKETYFGQKLRSVVTVLVDTHMRPFELYTSHKNGQKTRSALIRLARKLEAAGASIRLLSFVAEADQRGRNRDLGRPLSRENVGRGTDSTEVTIDEWQKWMINACQEAGISEKLPLRQISGDTIIKETSTKNGIIVGIISEWLYQDQLLGTISNEEDSLQKINEYFRILTDYRKKIEEKYTQESDQKKRKLIDNEMLILKDQDSREQFFSKFS